MRLKIQILNRHQNSLHGVPRGNAVLARTMPLVTTRVNPEFIPSGGKRKRNGPSFQMETEPRAVHGIQVEKRDPISP